MFRNWRKKYEKVIAVTVIVFIAVALLTLFIFSLFNLPVISAFLGGLLTVLMPFVYGFAIAYMCNPIYKTYYKYVFRFTERKKPHPKIRKTFSIILAFFTFFTAVGLLIFAIVPEIVENVRFLAANIGGYIDTVTQTATNVLNKLSEIIPSIKPDQIISSIGNIFTSSNTGEGGSFFSGIFASIIDIGSTIITQVFSFIVGIILSVYFLMYKDSLIARGKRLLCAVFKKKSYEKIVSFIKYTDKTFGKYLLGAILDSILVGFVVSLILVIFNFPFAALIGVIVGVTNIIPFFGPFLGGIPSALLILIAPDGGFGKVIAFALIIVIVQQIDGNIIAPHIHGSSTGMTPIGVIAAVTVCSYLFGFLGMLIGVPLCAVVSHYISCKIEKMLKKKKLPTNVDCYRASDIYNNEDFINTRKALFAQERIEHHEAIEKAIMENKITEEHVHQVGERIVEEIINSASEEIVTKAEKAEIEVLTEIPKVNKKIKKTDTDSKEK